MMKQEQELREKVVRLIMMKEAYKRQMSKQEQELREKVVKPLIVVEKGVVECIYI
jgi:hypothetical protein